MLGMDLEFAYIYFYNYQHPMSFAKMEGQSFYGIDTHGIGHLR